MSRRPKRVRPTTDADTRLAAAPFPGGPGSLPNGRSRGTPPDTTGRPRPDAMSGCITLQCHTESCWVSSVQVAGCWLLVAGYATTHYEYATCTRGGILYIQVTHITEDTGRVPDDSERCGLGTGSIDQCDGACRVVHAIRPQADSLARRRRLGCAHTLQDGFERSGCRCAGGGIAAHGVGDVEGAVSAVVMLRVACGRGTGCHQERQQEQEVHHAVVHRTLPPLLCHPRLCWLRGCPGVTASRRAEHESAVKVFCHVVENA